MWSADDSEIDRAIDAVARQMTAGEPSGSLRARVFDRLGERRAARRLAWIGVPVAAAAVAIVIALFVARDRRADVVTAPTVAHDRTAPPSATTTPPTTTVQPSTAVASVGAAIRTRQPASAPPSEVAALAPDVLNVTSIQLTAIEPAESIRLPRLDTIEPIAVPPIGEPQGDRP